MPVTPPEPEKPVSSGSQFLDEPPPVQPVQPPPAEPEMEVSEDEAQREEARLQPLVAEQAVTQREADDAVSRALKNIKEDDLDRAFSELKKAVDKYPKTGE